MHVKVCLLIVSSNIDRAEVNCHLIRMHGFVPLTVCQYTETESSFMQNIFEQSLNDQLNSFQEANLYFIALKNDLLNGIIVSFFHQPTVGNIDKL